MLKSAYPNLNSVKKTRLKYLRIFGLVGMVSTFGLFITIFLSGVLNQIYLFIGVCIAFPLLSGSVFCSYNNELSKSSYLAVAAMSLGIFASPTLDFPVFMSLISIFVLAGVFVTINFRQVVFVFSSLVIVSIVKLLNEAFQLNIFVVEGLSKESIIFISILFFSIFSFAYIVNKLIVQGLIDSESLECANKALKQNIIHKSRLQDIIAHDLSSPIRSMQGLLSMLYNREEKEETKATLKVISDTNLAAKVLLESLLIWSKIQVDKPFMQRATFNLCDCVQDSLNLHSMLIESKRIKIQNECAGVIELLGDKRVVSTIIRNLLSNAIKFSKIEGVIQISAEEKGSSIKISIRDFGVGMSPTKMNKLFSGSDIKSESGTLDEEGTGLGLLIIKDFIDAYHGEIGVESVLNEGSLFWFEIPVRVPFS